MMDLDSKVESLEKSDKDSRMVLPKKVVTIECMRCAPGSSEGSAEFGGRFLQDIELLCTSNT
jgi:hypothetical protein